jgi:hypothetical protein
MRLCYFDPAIDGVSAVAKSEIPPKMPNSTDVSGICREQVWRNVRLACELFDMARDIKTLELKRRYPDASDTWIQSEVLRLIEKGCQ